MPEFFSGHFSSSVMAAFASFIFSLLATDGHLLPNDVMYGGTQRPGPGKARKTGGNARGNYREIYDGTHSVNGKLGQPTDNARWQKP